jgi:predicted DCC family thiol-disulfide oxidoreductase YuxK
MSGTAGEELKVLLHYGRPRRAAILWNSNPPSPRVGGPRSDGLLVPDLHRPAVIINHSLFFRLVCNSIGEFLVPAHQMGHIGIVQISGNANPRGWVLYDDSCGFCRRWVPFWSRALRRRGFEIAPLQAAWVRERLRLSSDVLLQDLRLLLSDNTQLSGADVYRYLMRRIWWAYPLFLLSCTPGLRQVFDWGYQTFARNRFGVSRACGFSVRPGQGSEHP